MTKGEMVAAALPGWAGTPFHDHARVKGAGVDCKGLLWGVAEELGFSEAQSPYAKDVSYSLRKKRGVPYQTLKEGLAFLFDPVKGELKPGDILLLKMGGFPQHLAIVSSEGKAYHAQTAPNPFVKEASLRALLRKFPLDSAWRWRDGC